MKADDHYTIISPTRHAGGSHAQYREYLDPKYLDDFDAWREKYKNPFKDLSDTDLRVRNWDDERRNDRAGAPTASSARSSSRTPCRRSSRASCCSRSRRSPRSTSTASPASRRTTAGWSTSARSIPERRAGIGQIFLNDVDDAIEDVQWIKEHGLRGGVLLADVPPDVRLGEAALRPRTTTRCGRSCEDLERPGERARRHRLARLPAGAAPMPLVHHRDALLLAAPVRAPDRSRRVRAVPAS